MNTSHDTPSRIHVITLDNPPVNSLGHALRSRIVAAIEAAEADPTVKAMVLIGNDKAFSAGADVSEFGKPAQLAEPILRSVLARVEQCRKPVVAAIHGPALGGGLEVAMAAHYRLAMPDAKLGLNPRCEAQGCGCAFPCTCYRYEVGLKILKALNRLPKERLAIIGFWRKELKANRWFATGKGINYSHRHTPISYHRHLQAR